MGTITFVMVALALCTYSLAAAQRGDEGDKDIAVYIIYLFLLLAIGVILVKTFAV